jgi:hypothetical protein
MMLPLLVDGDAAVRHDPYVDPISLVVAAVALGASAGLTETATAVVKDAYDGLKRLLAQRNVDVSGVEQKPTSATQKEALHEILSETQDAVDSDVLTAARQVTEAVAQYSPQTAASIGISLRDIQAEFVRIGRVTSTGSGIVADGLRLSGGFSVDEIRAGGQGRHPSTQ